MNKILKYKKVGNKNLEIAARKRSNWSVCAQWINENFIILYKMRNADAGSLTLTSV